MGTNFYNLLVLVPVFAAGLLLVFFGWDALYNERPLRGAALILGGLFVVALVIAPL